MAKLQLTAQYRDYGDELWFGGEGCGMWIIESEPHHDLTAYLGGLGQTQEGRDLMEARARLLAAAPELYEIAELYVAKAWSIEGYTKALEVLAKARGEK